MKNEQVKFLICKTLKHLNSDPRKAVMYLAPLMVYKEKLSEEQILIGRKILNPVIKSLKGQGYLSNAESLRLDAEHVMASSILREGVFQQSIANRIHESAQLAQYGVELN